MLLSRVCFWHQPAKTPRPAFELRREPQTLGWSWGNSDTVRPGGRGAQHRVGEERPRQSGNRKRREHSTLHVRVDPLPTQCSSRPQPKTRRQGSARSQIRRDKSRLPSGHLYSFQCLLPLLPGAVADLQKHRAIFVPLRYFFFGEDSDLAGLRKVCRKQLVL